MRSDHNSPDSTNALHTAQQSGRFCIHATGKLIIKHKSLLPDKWFVRSWTSSYYGTWRLARLRFPLSINGASDLPEEASAARETVLYFVTYEHR